jgi:hypothetical protein
MKAVSRTNFIVAANIVWLAVIAVGILEVLAPDYTAWWRHVGASSLRSCNEDSYRYDVFDRLFLFSLIWLFSAPVMSLVAWRIPGQWPARFSRPWWNRTVPVRSLATAVAVFAPMLWPLSGMLHAPVTSTLILEGVRAVLLLGVLLYYRAAVLSA